MRNMTKREILRSEALVPYKFNPNACKDEIESLKRCWKLHGADPAVPNYPCAPLETGYKNCMSRGMFSRTSLDYDFGGEHVFDWMYKFCGPLRVLPHHLQDLKPHDYQGDNVKRLQKERWETRGCKGNFDYNQGDRKRGKRGKKMTF